MTAECVGDATGERRLRKLQERILHVDEQIAELQDKKGIMQHEIRELMEDEGETAVGILHEIRQLGDGC